MKNNLKTAWLIWSIPASFFSLVFVIRILPSFVMQNIISFYNINYAQFSLLPALYYIGYASMQIPAGILFTKFKNSTIIPSLMLIVCIGTCILAYSNSFYVACIASLIIGLGSTVGVLGASSIIKSKFTEQAYAFVLGLTLTFGLVAASYAGTIINTGLRFFNWKQLYSVATIIILTYAVVAFITIKDKNRPQNPLPDVSKDSVRSLLKKVFITKSIIPLAIFSGLMTAPMQGFADVWGISFLMAKFNLTKIDAIFCNSFIFLGMGIGSPIVGILAQKYKKLFSGIIVCGLIMFIGFIILLLPFNLNKSLIACLLLLIGIGSSFPTLTFTLIIENVNTKISKIAMSFSNMVLMSCGFIYHPMIGNLYDMFIQTHTPLITYTISISLIPCGLLTGIIGLLYFVKYKNNVKFV